MDRAVAWAFISGFKVEILAARVAHSPICFILVILSSFMNLL